MENGVPLQGVRLKNGLVVSSFHPLNGLDLRRG